MLDIKFIRENRDIVKDAVYKKNMNVDVDKLLRVDVERLELLREIEALRAEQNQQSQRIQTLENRISREQAIIAMRTLKDSLKIKESKYKQIQKKWQELMWQIPNIPDMSAPIGKDESENVEIKTWGELPSFDFEIKDHIELMKSLDMVDFERGIKVHGFRGYFLKNDGALLSWAIWNYAQDFFLKKGFTPMIVPSIVRPEHFYGTGHLPGEADDLYETQDGDYLSGTSEVSTMAYFAKEKLNKSDLPIKILAFSPAYRREAGSHGKDVNGLIRVHEFFKFEQLILCEASHQESVKLHDWLNNNTEEFIQSLGIPYHVVDACTGDMGQGKVRMYDIELWVPQQDKYREISSASYYHDFQTRRFDIRYKNDEGEMRFAHSLNCTAAPTPRILVSLVENFQQEDGTIKIPEVLRPYLNNREYLGK